MHEPLTGSFAQSKEIIQKDHNFDIGNESDFVRRKNPGYNADGSITPGGGMTGGWVHKSSLPTVDPSAFLTPGAVVMQNVTIGKDAKMQSFALAEQGANLKNNAYVGHSARIGQNATVGAFSAVVDKAHLHDGHTLPDRQSLANPKHVAAHGNSPADVAHATNPALLAGTPTPGLQQSK